MIGTSLDTLPGEIVVVPGSAGYRAATSPHNSSFPHEPAAVVRPRSATEVAAAAVAAGRAGLRIAVQATGHGAGHAVDVCGYTVRGGVGWLVRPFGLASASLRAVRYVDGRGGIHEERDGDAVWAFRGGAAVADGVRRHHRKGP